jgi:hypothetical protein
MRYISILQYGINEIKLIKISPFAIWAFALGSVYPISSLTYRVEATGLPLNESKVTPHLSLFSYYLSLKGIKVCKDFQSSCTLVFLL